MVYNCPKCGLESKSEKRLKIGEDLTCEHCDTVSKVVLMFEQDIEQVTENLITTPVNRIDALAQGFLQGNKQWVFKPIKTGGYNLALLDKLDVEDWGDKPISLEDVTNLLANAKNNQYIQQILEQISHETQKI